MSALEQIDRRLAAKRGVSYEAFKAERAARRHRLDTFCQWVGSGYPEQIRSLLEDLYSDESNLSENR
jgi:hypothetical protein